MVLTRKRKSDLIFWAGFGLIVAFLYLTPWGSSTRAWMGGLFLSSPNMEKHEANKDNFLSSDWNLQNINENKILISETNKPIFINIWATWCGPCRTEMPSINNLYNKYKNDVEFILVSPDETIEVLKEFGQNNAYNFPIYTSISQTPIQLQTNSYPTTIIIDKNKNITYKMTGAHDWDTEEVYSILDELINK
jgi:thiol-disulfide isomerase/thioredoxin